MPRGTKTVALQGVSAAEIKPLAANQRSLNLGKICATAVSGTDYARPFDLRGYILAAVFVGEVCY
jgi:hypothetical protein